MLFQTIAYDENDAEISPSCLYLDIHPWIREGLRGAEGWPVSIWPERPGFQNS